MNGAESLVHTLLASGVDTCFANPGTSEMHFVSALDRIPGMRCVLGLQENIVTGAADAFWRIAGRPAATLLHCGPGLANGIANLHNARRAHSGIVNIVGDQATEHRPLDAPLTSDTEGLARFACNWVRTTASAQHVGRDAAAAVQAARTWPGQIATLVLPADAAWNDGGEPSDALPVPPPPQAAPRAVDNAARALRSGEPALLLLGGRSLTAEALAAAHRIAAATGARMLTETHIGLIERGRGRVPIDRLLYRIDPAKTSLADIRHLILVNTGYPVSFFAYPGKSGRLAPPACQVHELARADQDGPAALRALVEALHAPEAPLPEVAPPAGPARGPLTREGVARTVAALLPENAIVMDEGSLFGGVLYPASYGAAPHSWMQQTGGAIGAGIPMAVGAALAAPDRRVISMQADGSGMYTLQGLWTQARENLDVTTIVLSNRKYAILIDELANVGAKSGKTAQDMFSLADPELDWPAMAKGMGVEARRAESCEELADLLRASVRRSGPFLIELPV